MLMKHELPSDIRSGEPLSKKESLRGVSKDSLKCEGLRQLRIKGYLITTCLLGNQSFIIGNSRSDRRELGKFQSKIADSRVECSTPKWGGGGGGGGDRGREGYGRREKKGREAGSLRWREAGEKFKKAVKETNPTTFLDFHFTFSEA